MRSYFLRTILLLVIIHIAYVLFAQPVIGNPMFYTFVSGYSVNDNMLTIDSFSCDGGIMTRYIKPLTLYKQ